MAMAFIYAIPMIIMRGKGDTRKKKRRLLENDDYCGMLIIK